MARHYEFCDRLHVEDYRGRWRYSVIETDVSTLARRKTFTLTFRRRSDAASFFARCRSLGVEVAARAMGSEGMRPGDDFRLQDHDASNQDGATEHQPEPREDPNPNPSAAGDP